MPDPNVKNLEWAAKCIEMILSKWIENKRHCEYAAAEHAADLELLRKLESLSNDLHNVFRQRTS